MSSGFPRGRARCVPHPSRSPRAWRSPGETSPTVTCSRVGHTGAPPRIQRLNLQGRPGPRLGARPRASPQVSALAGDSGRPQGHLLQAAWSLEDRGCSGRPQDPACKQAAGKSLSARAGRPCSSLFVQRRRCFFSAGHAFMEDADVNNDLHSTRSLAGIHHCHNLRLEGLDRHTTGTLS